ncbi:MAG TPA: S8 family serine peptidase, partial [Polyangiaceae bacterium]|nr:S8 family serine peptidase [Polyangiaceae bacterium]
MRSNLHLVALAALALAACNSPPPPTGGPGAADPGADEAPAAGARFLTSARPVKDRYIVVLRDEPARDARQAANDLAAAYRGQVGQVFRHALQGFVAEMTEVDAKRLSEDPRVKYVEEDGVMSISATQPNATWGLDRVDQRALPLDQSYTYNTAGGGVNAYVIDTGIRVTHAEFGGRAAPGFSSINDANGSNDCNGHGTHVAGTIGGSTYGVAKAVNLHAVRVLDCGGSGTTAGVIAGVDWVTANFEAPAVANMSLGGGASQALDDAVAASINAGVIYALAAGNENQNACNRSPARTPAAITVGSTTLTDARSSFSNFGTCVDLFAPGSSITSAWHTGDSATNTISGTSMASPHVAGAIALYLGSNPTASPEQVAGVLTTLATPGAVTNPGTGSPNLLLFTASLGDGNGDNEAPTAAVTAPADGATVAGTVTLEADASDNVGVTRVSFFVNNAFLGTDTEAPFSLAWNTTLGGNGAHAVVAKAFDAGGNVGSSAAVTVTVNNPGQASYDPALKAPHCTDKGAVCDSGTLVVGRGNVGPEQNAPNTVNASCVDGNLGSFHNDESLDRIRVSTLDGSTMTVGKTVKIEATVWAWSTGSSDSLDLFYAADATNPTWTYLTTMKPTSGGAHVLSATYTLPEGGVQAVRGNFRFLSTQGVCSTGSFNDRDDLVFDVLPAAQPPVASFSQACTSLSCGFTDASTDPDGDIVAWAWNFGDGATSADQNPAHAYAASGTYTVSLTVTDGAGFTSTTQQDVSVIAAPAASFTFTCLGPDCDFADASSDVDGDIVAWSWNFGDGTTSNEQNPAHSFPQSGTYEVSLTVTDSTGQTSTVQQSVAVAATIQVTAVSSQQNRVKTVTLTWTGAT